MSAAAASPVVELGPMTRLAHGRKARCLYLLHRLLGKLSGGRASLQVYLLCAQPIGDNRHAGVRDDPASPVRLLHPGDPLLAGLPRPPEVIAQRFAAGHRCFGIDVKGEFAGCIWIARDVYNEDEVRCQFRLSDNLPNENRPSDNRRNVWDFDVYVAPRFRTGRTLARLWKGVDKQLVAEGVAWTTSRIGLYNPASVAAHERLGARLLGTACFLVLGPWQLSWLPRAPYLHLSLHRGQVPSLALAPPP